MANRAVSEVALWWSHAGYDSGSAALGAAFRMDSSVSGIDEMTVSGYSVTDTVNEHTGISAGERQRRSAKLNDVADVTVSYVNDFAKADGPAKFFKAVFDDANKRPLTLEWRYETGQTDKAQFLVESVGRPIEVGTLVMGNVTLKYYGAGRVETRT